MGSFVDIDAAFAAPKVTEYHPPHRAGRAVRPDGYQKSCPGHCLADDLPDHEDAVRNGDQASEPARCHRFKPAGDQLRREPAPASPQRPSRRSFLERLLCFGIGFKVLQTYRVAAKPARDQLLAHGAHMQRHAETRLNPLLQVRMAPAHHPVYQVAEIVLQPESCPFIRAGSGYCDVCRVDPGEWRRTMSSAALRSAWQSVCVRLPLRSGGCGSPSAHGR